jgi:hypothetical protein
MTWATRGAARGTTGFNNDRLQVATGFTTASHATDLVFCPQSAAFKKKQFSLE